MNNLDHFDEDNIPFMDELPIVANAKNPVISLNPFDNIKPLDLRTMLQTEPEPLDMVLHGLVKGTIGSLVSPGAMGKSVFTIQIALQIATGRDMLGLGELKHGRVVIFAGEDPPQVLHHRLYAICRHFCFTPAEIEAAAKNVTIFPTVGKSIDILNKHVMSGIMAITVGARLFIFDTLSRFHGLDENKAEDAKRIMGALEELAHRQGAACIFPHHVSKAAVAGGMTDLQQAARGSSVFVDNARWASFLAVMTKEEAEKRQVPESDRTKFVRWNISKQNYSAPISDLWLERKNGGVLVPANFSTDEQNADSYKRASQPSRRQKNGAI